jgi:hypothetical protein
MSLQTFRADAAGASGLSVAVSKGRHHASPGVSGHKISVSDLMVSL